MLRPLFCQRCFPQRWVSENRSAWLEKEFRGSSIMSRHSSPESHIEIPQHRNQITGKPASLEHTFSLRAQILSNDPFSGCLYPPATQ